MEVPVVGASIWLIVKIFFIVGLGVYLVFALVVLKQIKIMTDTLDVGFEIPIKLLSYLHFIFAFSVLAFAIVAL